MNILIIVGHYVFMAFSTSFAYNGSLFLNGKVLGGTMVERGEMKFMASLRNNNSHICGGFLIDDRHIVTAAHCLEKLIVPVIPVFADYSVMIGDIFFNAENKTHPIGNAIAHGKYEFENTNPHFDIGLIRLQSPVAKSDTIDWIDLSKCEPETPGIATSAGWGVIHVVRDPKIVEISNYLKKVLLHVISHRACTEKIDNPSILDETLLCAFGVNKFENVAKGDSGGPLVQGENIIGLVVHVPYKPKNAAFFIKVNIYYEWIEKAKAHMRTTGGVIYGPSSLN